MLVIFVDMCRPLSSLLLVWFWASVWSSRRNFIHLALCVGCVAGAGIGLGFPGLQIGFGVGAGCGVGVGFGYGLGKGRAYDENGTYSNVGRLPKRSGVSIAGSSGWVMVPLPSSAFWNLFIHVGVSLVLHPAEKTTRGFRPPSMLCWSSEVRFLKHWNLDMPFCCSLGDLFSDLDCFVSYCRAEIGAIIDDLVSGVKRALDGIQNENGKRRR